eukprot:TRINITY_DN10929_c0_g2_i1.p1 TRINITY_DN10929_c0_g2~~TRINITY_DN10929_c0_g2_i1.p1  ORF type:complete len:144 (+),score=12.00 TRINITY_DN10929_c0_g2_i1:68-499(+)
MERTLSECSTVDADAASGLLSTQGIKSNAGPEESITSWTDAVQERTCSKRESASGVASLHSAHDASDTWSLGHLGQCHVATPLLRMHKAPSRAKRTERQRLIDEAVAHALALQQSRVALRPKPHESSGRDDRRSCQRSMTIVL